MDVGTRVELECSYGPGDDRTRSRVVSMPKERSGGPRLDWSCDWEKYGYDKFLAKIFGITLLTCMVPIYPMPHSSPIPYVQDILDYIHYANFYSSIHHCFDPFSFQTT